MDVLENHPWLTVAAVLAVVAYVIVRGWSAEPLNARDLLAPPVILTGVGVYEVLRSSGLAPGDYVWAACGVAIGLGCGAWRGSTVRLFVKDGVLWQRYPRRGLAVWAVSLALSGGFGLIAALAGMDPHARPVVLSIGVGLLGEAAVVGVRAVASGLPLAAERRDTAGPAVHEQLRLTLRGQADREELPTRRLRDSLHIAADRLRRER